MSNYDVQVPQATITLGENRYLLCFDMYGFLQLEEFGDSIEAILAEFERKPLGRLVDVIYSFAIENHPDIVKADLAKGVPLIHIREASKIIMKLLPEAMEQLKVEQDGELAVVDNSKDPAIADKLKAEGK